MSGTWHAQGGARQLLRRAAAQARQLNDTEAAHYFKGLVKFFSALHITREYVGEITMCVGPSMLPTINAEGDVVLLDKTAAWRGTIGVGDIVIANSPKDPAGSICKRVCAVEGDIVSVAPRAWHEDDRTVVIPQGHVWLEGDNKSNSTDSREYGPVPAALIRGRVCAKIWPLNQFGRVSMEPPAPPQKSPAR